MEQGLAQSSLDIRGVYPMLRRHVRLLGLGPSSASFLALALLVYIRPQYTATTTLMIDSREEKVLSDAIVSPFRPSSIAIASEAAVIVAPNVAEAGGRQARARQGPGIRGARAPGMLGTAKAQLFMLFGIRPREAQQRRRHER